MNSAMGILSMRFNRRRFLRAAGVSLALPWLEALAPRGAQAAAAATPRRLVCICTPLGLHAPFFFPQQAGKDYTLSPYLEVLAEFRSDFTVVSGLSHPDVGPSHDSGCSFLTGAPHPERRAGFRNTISLDQLAAEHIGDQTRFATLALACEGFGLSWTRSGAPVPADSHPAAVFARLFLEGRPEEVEAHARRLRDGRSILDSVRDQVQTMQPALAAADRDKLDEYFTSVRELERSLAVAEKWSQRPKPKVNAKPPQPIDNPADLIGKSRVWFDLMHLALQTDSCRLITLMLLGTSFVPPVPGVTLGHHDLSHHGQDPKKIEQLKKVELALMAVFRDFLKKLKETKEDGVCLLDRTAVLLGSNLGNAATHAVKNLPFVLAGGGFRHGRYLAFDPNNPPPLSNLYVSLLHRLGIAVDRFATSTGTLQGLEAIG
jgi:hypothetical protein